MPYIRHLYYEEAGSGYPVILIHCPALSHVYWKPVMATLSQHCRCIAIDLRGHGRSGLGDLPWSLCDIAADLEMLIQRLHLPEPPVLVGYSSGGSICLKALLDFPDQYAGAALIGGFSECSTLRLRGKSLSGLLAVRAGLSPVVGASIAATNNASLAHRQELMPDATRVRPHGLHSYIQQTMQADFTPRLGEIRQPVLLLYGAKDEGMHRYYRILRQGLRHAETIFVPGTDHHLATQQPTLTANLLAQFVRGLEPCVAEPRVLPTWELPHIEEQPNQEGH